MSVEEGWRRGYAIFPGDRLTALLGEPVADALLLGGGLRNTNYRVRLASGEAVLRIYTAEAAACARESALLPLLVAHGIPVPHLLRAQPTTDPPWALLQYVDGVRFDRQPAHDIGRAAFDAGRVLAAIHAFPLHQAKHVDLNRYSGGGFGFVEFIEASLSHGVLLERLGEARTRRLREIIREYEPVLANQQATLQHSDYKPWNLLVRDGRIAAVLDWEFAFAGPRLNDIANFIRYKERQPDEYFDGFVRGYLESGGTLPDDWFRLARLQDLMGLAETVGRPDLDPAVLRDLQPLVERTIDLFPA